MHQPYGGVVPELAARSHVEIIDKLIKQALTIANISLKQIKLIAATGGPGLIGGIITSVMVAKKALLLLIIYPLYLLITLKAML